MRCYQGGKTPLEAVTITTRLVDDHDAAVASTTATLDAAAFDATSRAADHLFRVPLTGLHPGAYWLSIAAALGKTVATRDVRFVVK